MEVVVCVSYLHPGLDFFSVIQRAKIALVVLVFVFSVWFFLN